MKKLKMKMTQWLKKCWVFCTIILIVLAILLSLFRALTPWVEQYQTEVEQHLSALLGQPVKMKSIETAWYWFQPVVKLNQVMISDSSGHGVALNQLLVGINVISSLWHWKIQPGILAIEDVHLTVRRDHGQWQVDGLSEGRRPITFSKASYAPLVNWLIAQDKIMIKQVSATVYVDDQLVLPIQAFNLTLQNRSGHYRLKARGQLNQMIPTDVSILADFELDAASQLKGEAYLLARHLLPAQWQDVFPQLTYEFKGGEGDVEVWFDFEHSRIQQVQSKLGFRHIAWSHSGQSKHYFIQNLNANLSWQSTLEGWKLSGNEIKLRMNNISWPENQLIVEYQQDHDRYHLFIEQLLLNSVFAMDVEWPDWMKPALDMRPHGILKGTQIQIDGVTPSYFLTRFEQVGWKGRDMIPGMEQLSGALHWQPTEGRLELQAVNAVLAPPQLPPVSFDKIAIGANWKALSHGIRVHLDQFVMRRKDLTLTASGGFDHFSQAKDKIHLTAQYSAEHAEQWLAYLPESRLKPKLYDWLTTQIKQIRKASGQLKVNGNLLDFPFDHHPGEFVLTNHLHGVELLAVKDWPLIKEIDAYLRFDKRMLDANIYHADFQGVTVDQMHLKMDEIGLDREILLLHTQTKTLADKLMAYVFQTPLKQKLAKLDLIKSMSGPLDLNLRLEIPLYQDNTQTLVFGEIQFEQNQIEMSHALNHLELNEVRGTLQFDEHGILDSAFNARILEDPIRFQIRSVREKDPYTQVKFHGNPAIDALKNKIDLPIFDLMRGHLKLDGVLKMTDDPEAMEKLQIKTALQGVALDLPGFLGKSSEASAPLAIDIDFNLQKAMKIRVNYQDRLLGDLFFLNQGNQLRLKKGTIRFGKGPLLQPDQAGVQLIGEVPELKVEQWQKTLSKISNKHDTSSLLDSIRRVELNLGRLSFGTHRYEQVFIRGALSDQGIWHLKVKQKNMLANLAYQPKQYRLSGKIEFLDLSKPDFSNQSGQPATYAFNPEQIPNLDLHIAALKIGGIEMGTVDLNSTSKPLYWELHRCEIKSDHYELRLKGHWKKTDRLNQTEFQGYLSVSDLEKNLARWDITPVVEARHSAVEFEGRWPGALYDFSLARLRGKLEVLVKDGRITHLSTETEEKLGLGKLLSILSLQTIPRRLKLDFSDLSHKGYTFDQFKGDFQLTHGVLNTQNSTINGPVAFASMEGSLDLIRQLYDLELQITPHITASLPVVATIAGGPIAGVATWVASKLINHGMTKISGYRYKISGPWLEPVVQQVSMTQHP